MECGRSHAIERKREKKNPPLLYNLGGTCRMIVRKRFKISPDETLRIVQELYEKKLVTYPRTDARVLVDGSSEGNRQKYQWSVKHDTGFCCYLQDNVLAVLGAIRGLAKTRYVNDKQITDHYAIIPTGQGLGALRSRSSTIRKQSMNAIVQTFPEYFLSAGSQYQKVIHDIEGAGQRAFYASFKVLADEGYLKVAGIPIEKHQNTTGTKGR